VVGLGPLSWIGPPPSLALVDGDAGIVVFNPEPETRRLFEHRMAAANAAQAAANAGRVEPACTADGRPIAVLLNVAAPEDLADLDPAICDGIGLVRTEFLFSRKTGLPDEQVQYRAYRRIAEWACGKPVVLRTLDAGGDKPVEGLTVAGESNPFLGTRGIRLSLARPDIFKVQLRAMARAAVHGAVKIMLPMITVPQEIDSTAALLDGVVTDLKLEGIACLRPPLGIMVEVPAVAIVPALFRAAAFFSIGSNDLTQYVTAAARDISGVSALNDYGHPAVANLIEQVVAAGAKLGRDVSLCGDMGGDPKHLPALLAAGLRSVSVAPPLVGRVKRAIASIDVGRQA